MKNALLFVVIVALRTNADAQNTMASWGSVGTLGGTMMNGSVGVHASIGQTSVGSAVILNVAVQSGFLTNPVIRGPLTSVEDSRVEALEFSLAQNYPNPFNPSTTIKFELQKSSQVTLSVFDVLGREVSVLVNERRDAGVHEVKLDASSLSSGVYFYRLQAGDFVQTRKLLLVR
jgi:hypothetical protein